MDKINLTNFARTVQAIKNCIQSGNTEWEQKHQERLDSMCANLPSGSGFDSGTKFLPEKSNPQKLVFSTSFHHMDDNGYYDGWTDHTITITPEFGSFRVSISGRNRRRIKDYIFDVFYDLFEV